MNRNPGLSAVLSFLIPGLGQIYNGLIGAGIAVAVLCIALVTGGSLAFAYGNFPLAVLLFMLAFVTWVSAIYEAFSYAKEGPGGYDATVLKSLIQASVLLVALLALFVFMFTLRY